MPLRPPVAVCEYHITRMRGMVSVVVRMYGTKTKDRRRRKAEQLAGEEHLAA